MRFSKESYILTLIFLLAFILRLIFVLHSSDLPVSDAVAYDSLGLSIAEGKGYVNNSGTPHSHYPPFYPFFLSIIYTFFAHSYVAVRIVQSMIGAFSCVLIYLIGKRIRNVAVGALASFISMVYPPFIKSAELLLTELIFTFLLCLIVFYLLKIQEDTRFRNYIILGFLLGITVLTKSVSLFLPLFVIPVFIYSKERHLPVILKRYVLVFLIFGLSIAPWVIRNYNVYHKFAPTSVEGGFGFYSSYRPANGIFGLNAASDDPVVIEGFKISSPVLRSKYFIKKTLDFIVSNSQKVIILEVKKLLYFWAPFDWEVVGGRWFNLIYVMLAPFFMWGFFIAAKDFKNNYPVLIPVIYFQIMTLAFYGSPRFRLPIEPFLFILASNGILHCLNRCAEVGKWLDYQLKRCEDD